MSDILITGGNGALAGSLIPVLLKQGHRIRTLTTRINNKEITQKAFLWNIKEGFIEQNAFEGVDVIVHLAGANVGKRRWTEGYKREILDSRVLSTRLLFNHLKNGHGIKKFIGMSGIGYYPDPCADVLNENSEGGHSFMAEVCKQWETETLKFETLGIPVTLMRTAPVLMKNSGLLGTYAASLPFRILPTTGSSKNYLSWIHLQDLNRFILEAIQPGKFEGIWNLSAPKPATQKQFVEAIDKAVGHKNLHPNVPAWILKMVLGERAALPLTNQRVSADKLISKGFEFQFPEIETAMANLFSQNKNSVK